VQSWTPEQIKEFSDLVVSSVGIDKKRGDTLEIRNIEFRNEDFEEAQRIIDEREQKNHTQTIVTYAVLGLAVLLFFLLVVRPFVKWVVENTVDSVDTFLPQTVEELERIQKTTAVPQMEDLVPILPESLDPNKVEGEMIKEKIITLVENNPHKAALVLRDWLHEHPKDRTVKPEKEKKAAG
jgi:flagellar M-ring protein FliF